MVSFKQSKLLKHRLLYNFNKEAAKAQGWRFKILPEWEDFKWYKDGKLILSFRFREWSEFHNGQTTLKRLNNLWAIIQTVMDYSLEHRGMGIVQTHKGRFYLDNPFSCPIHPHPQPTWQTHWFSEGIYPIRYEELDDFHLANIVYYLGRQGKCKNQIIEEISRRFGREIVGLKFARQHLCEPGIQSFIEHYGFQGRVLLTVRELLDRLDYDRSNISYLIKEVAKWYSKLYSN